MNSIKILYFYLLMLPNMLLANNKTYTKYDIQQKKKLLYEIKQSTLLKTSYSLFDPIHIDYPQLISGSDTKINIEAVNRLIKFHSIERVTTDSFKYEFLPFAYKALFTVLNSTSNSNYSKQTVQNTVPTIKDIEGEILFWNGDVISYQVIYEFNFDFQYNTIGELAYIQTYYIKLSEGKMINWESFFSKEKLQPLQKHLNKSLNEIKQQQKARINNFSWNDDSENEGSDDDEESEEKGIQKSVTRRPISITNTDFKNIYFRLTPFLVEFIIPPFSSSFSEFKQLGVCIQMKPDEFNTFLAPANPLGNWFKQKFTSITGLTAEKFKVPHYTVLISPLNIENNFYLMPPGVSRQSLYQEIIRQKDTIFSLLRHTYFDSGGKITKHVFSDKNESVGPSYFYDKKGNLIRTIINTDNEDSEETIYHYNEQNNITEFHQYSSDFDQEVQQYFYDDTVAYINNKISLFYDHSLLQEPVWVYVFNQNKTILTSYELYSSQEWWNKYQGNLLLCTYDVRYPNMGNVFYSYDSSGRLECITADNGRQLHSFEYQNDKLIAYTHYDSFRIMLSCKYFYDADNKLIAFEEYNSYHSSPRKFILQYKYRE